MILWIMSEAGCSTRPEHESTFGWRVCCVHGRLDPTRVRLLRDESCDEP